MKKWMSLLLALVMALSLCSFAWADGEKATVVDDVLSATLAQEMAVLSAPAYTSGGQDEWVVLGLPPCEEGQRHGRHGHQPGGIRHDGVSKTCAGAEQPV